MDSADDGSSNGYAVMTIGQYREYARKLRIDENTDSEWQCPTCSKRVKNLQRRKTDGGKPCWGCRACCDTVDASYFGGKACKLYEKGNSALTWF